MRTRPNQRRTTLKVRQRRRRVFYAIGGLLLASYVTYEFFFDTMGVLKYLNMKRTQGQLAEEIKAIEEENARLKKNVEAVRHDPATLEGLARDRLGLVKEGETVFLIPPGAKQGQAARPSVSPEVRP